MSRINLAVLLSECQKPKHGAPLGFIPIGSMKKSIDTAAISENKERIWL